MSAQSDELAAFAPSKKTALGAAHSINPFTGMPSSAFAYLAARPESGGMSEEQGRMVSPEPSGGDGNASAPDGSAGGSAGSKVGASGGGRGQQGWDNTPVGRGGKTMCYARDEGAFAGLVNQGATCYLNSLLQALYLTPRFRLRFSAGTLQKLFARLAVSEKAALDTVELTTSFRWTTAEAFRQHDVQELLRVLFGVLELVKEPESEAGVVQALYGGTLRDSVVCLGCGHAAVRLDAFLDVSLYMDATIGSLEQALAAFVAPERLTGDNQYACSGCETKVDADKGLTFGDLPPVLSFQLKRFVYDWQANRRVKLNQKLTFPLVLDMAPYMADSGEAPMLYDAYAVLLHSGSAHSGHYFAFVKCPATGVWHEFNDASVRAIDDLETALEVAYGSDASTRSGSAYLLLYAKQGASGPVPAVPSELRALVAAEDAAWREEVANHLREVRTMRFTVVSGSQTVEVALDQGEPVAALKAAALDALHAGADGGRPADDDARLRAYTRFASGATMAGAPLDTEPEARLESLGLGHRATVVLETRAAGEKFATFDPDAFLVVALAVTHDNVAELVAQARMPVVDGMPRVWLKPTMDFDEAAAAVQSAVPSLEACGALAWYTVDGATLHAVHVRAAAHPGVPLVELGIRPGSVVYVEPATSSLFGTVYEAKVTSIVLEYNEPVAEDAKVSGPVAYTRSVSLSKHRTVGELKAKMAMALGVEASGFTIARSPTDEQLKDETLSLEAAHLFDGAPVFVRLGTPLAVGEYKVRLVLYDPLHPSGRALWPLRHAVVNASQPVADIQTAIKAVIDEHYPPTEKTLAAAPNATNKFRLKHLRLRTLAGPKRVGKVLFRKRSLRVQARVKDGMVLVVQPIAAPEELTPAHVVFFVQAVDAAAETAAGVLIASSRSEVVFKRAAKAVEVVHELAARLGLDAELAVAVAPAFSKLEPTAVRRLKWRRVAGLKESATLSGPPLNVTDGALVLVRDARVAFGDGAGPAAGPATGSRRKRGARGRTSGGASGLITVTVDRPRPKERPLQIFTEERSSSGA
ncbi:ubiquitin carboxyl-terminal hydrolase [Thecamonas trahens ATCC 50062]|uniref:Ubiquitin carboxyl-terminal hydrolase n=1 Tax=Thecamonas trahens ATCC 50062 TaxID=461836 RepID=A0A0L0DDM4_THETB|nr:ubiquitin carboxyl-terminal hydrolase [Thecamonas trahens ATCC 50062]KNC50447.1 ubiquitin carboxyl-terminal hydrolase [Thecamonas trahens ATCC 50062]|eukprot:XP_013762343.1 ubiquitin carboxyl-terminal hydrolase [Thecamonas trahens ATCC 50062]